MPTTPSKSLWVQCSKQNQNDDSWHLLNAHSGKVYLIKRNILCNSFTPQFYVGKLIRSYGSSKREKMRFNSLVDFFYAAHLTFMWTYCVRIFQKINNERKKIFELLCVWISCFIIILPKEMKNIVSFFIIQRPSRKTRQR